MAHDVRNPHIFVDGPGNTASGDQVMDNFDALWTKADQAQQDYVKMQEGAVALGTLTNGTYPFTPAFAVGGVATLPAPLKDLVWREDPADYALTGRTVKYRLKVALEMNAVAPGVTFTFGLATPTVAFGASGVSPTVTALTPVGSTAVIVAPGASAETLGDSGDFTAPAAGRLAIYVTVSANMAANSLGAILWKLLRRTV